MIVPGTVALRAQPCVAPWLALLVGVSLCACNATSVGGEVDGGVAVADATDAPVDAGRRDGFDLRGIVTDRAPAYTRRPFVPGTAPRIVFDLERVRLRAG